MKCKSCGKKKLRGGMLDKIADLGEKGPMINVRSFLTQDEDTKLRNISNQLSTGKRGTDTLILNYEKVVNELNMYKGKPILLEKLKDTVTLSHIKHLELRGWDVSSKDFTFLAKYIIKKLPNVKTVKLITKSGEDIPFSMVLVAVMLREDLSMNIAFNGQTILLFAIKMENLDLVNYLVAELEGDEKVDVNYVNYMGAITKRTALLSAISTRNIELIKLLLTNGADPNQIVSRAIPLSVVAVLPYDDIDTQLETMKLLLDNGADINLKNSYNINSLFVAILNNKFEVFKFLLDRGAIIAQTYKTIINSYDRNGSTPDPRILKMLKDVISARKTAKKSNK
jgi:ankyrin repeat protein